MEANRSRDRRVSRQLRLDGWSVISVRERILKTRPDNVARRILRILKVKSDGLDVENDIL